MSPNIFDYMEEVHINQVWTELEERFGFPIKTWKKHFAEHLDSKPRSENILNVFLRYGSERINPILNGILIRREGFPTFHNLCEYVIRKSPAYQNELKKDYKYRKQSKQIFK